MLINIIRIVVAVRSNSVIIQMPINKPYVLGLLILLTEKIKTKKKYFLAGTNHRVTTLFWQVFMSKKIL